MNKALEERMTKFAIKMEKKEKKRAEAKVDPEDLKREQAKKI
jgi:hypothetical protein